MNESRFREGQYVIPKERLWKKPFLHYKNDLNTSRPFYYHYYPNEFPIWEVLSTIPGGFVLVQTNFDREEADPEAIIVKEDDITSDFFVRLPKNRDINDKRGVLGEPSEDRVGIIIKPSQHWTLDNTLWWVQDTVSGNMSRYSTYELDFVDMESIKEKARQLRNLKLVSKQGFLPPPVPNNTSKIVFSQFTGYPERTSIDAALKDLKQKVSIPRHTQNLALRAGPLPHGPQESNFAGGKRKTRRIHRKKKTHKSK